MSNNHEQGRNNFDSFNGRFTYIEFIRQSSQGAVLKIQNKQDNKCYCLKYANRLLVDKQNNQINGCRSGDNFLKERALLGDLSNAKNLPSSICRTFFNHIVANPDNKHNYYYIMEYCSGGELIDFVATRLNKVPPNKQKLIQHKLSIIKNIMNQIIGGIHYLHINNIYHGDLSLENVLIENVLIEKIKIKIIDFGGCKVFRQNTPYYEHVSNNLLGKAPYVSPELYHVRKGRFKKLKISKNYYHCGLNDIHTLGIMLFTMVFGFFPYDDTKHDFREYFITHGTQNLLGVYKRNKLVLQLLKSIGDELKPICDLIDSMTRLEDKRINIIQLVTQNNWLRSNDNNNTNNTNNKIENNNNNNNHSNGKFASDKSDITPKTNH